MKKKPTPRITEDRSSSFRPISKLLIPFLLILLTVTAFWQVRNNGFINFDDDVYVVKNPYVNRGLTLKGISWAFTTLHAGNWHPLTWISHMIDVKIYGLQPGGHHLTSLILHIANTLLLFLVFQRMTQAPWKSGFVAALFALHPLHVESVAWVAERKDVLSTLFWMFTLWTYVRYAANPQARTFLLVTLFLILGLMSKPMVVTLPFVLLLLDYWPLGRLRKDGRDADNISISGPNTSTLPLRRLITEKIRLFTLVSLSCLVTLFAQWKGGAVRTFEKFPLDVRVANALVAYADYIWKMVWPKNLAILYPHPLEFPPWQVVTAIVLLLSITMLVFVGRRKHPYLLTGWLWYVGTLVPVIGLVQVGIQATADRYTYIPLIGLFVMLSYGIPELLTVLPFRRVVLSISGGLVLLALVSLTQSQVKLWEKDTVLFEHTLQVTKDNYVIHNNLGNAFFDQGKNEDAMIHYKEALRINPKDANVHNNLAILLTRLKKDEEAIYHFKEALGSNPVNPEIHNSLGVLLARRGRLDEAMGHYREALRLAPENAHAHFNLASLLSQQGRREDAIGHYMKALQIKPDYPECHNDLAVLLADQGKIDEAIAHLTEAVRLRPDYGEAHSNLGIVLIRKGRMQEAVEHFDRALRISPQDARVHNNLGAIRAHEGKDEEAIAHYSKALELDPRYGDAHFGLAALLEKRGKVEEAMAHYQEASRINPNDVEARLHLGRLLARQKKHQEAMAQLNEAIRINPRLGEAYFYLGVIYLRLGKKDLALKALNALESVDARWAARLSEEMSR